MSRPSTFTPPPGARAYPLRTGRGDFAVIDAPAPTASAKGTVLLLPGFTGSKEDFIALHEPLAAAGYRSIAVDGRGQYESKGPEEDEAPYAQDELARDVLAQVDAIGEPVHLLGHSLGGLISRAAVLRDPEPFRSLTLVACGAGAISEPQQHRVKLLRDLLAVQSMAEAWETIQRLEPPEELDVDGVAGTPGVLRRRWLQNSPAQLIATGRQLCGEPDRTDQLAAVDLPKHVLSGERDHAWPVPDLDRMAHRLGAHRSIVPGTEHSPNTERPEEMAAALVAFWDGC
ncbi:alpha/beta fold hydrolase [Streptomyces sp. TS71-3]|uniref:alpha/beta fold hydrolase n=1 Tax=Streptomyces sp. TS71-3 TaxID=2733862 RepID=UPI001BB3539F|nr:alpha/beta fold hydrolase [Streptomyces sp. TS71-3]